MTLSHPEPSHLAFLKHTLLALASKALCGLLVPQKLPNWSPCVISPTCLPLLSTGTPGRLWTGSPCVISLDPFSFMSTLELFDDHPMTFLMTMAVSFLFEPASNLPRRLCPRGGPFGR